MVVSADYAGVLERARQQRADRAGQIARAMLRPVTQLPSSVIRYVVGASAVLVALIYVTGLSDAGLSMGVAALLAVLVASTLSSIAGFAFSAICGVMLLSLMSDPIQVVEIMMICSVGIQGFSVIMLRRDIAWADLPAFLIGGLAGLPIGVGLLLHLGHGGIKSAIGVLLIAYAAYAIFRPGLVIRSPSRMMDAAIGLVGGITGGLAGFPGAAVTVWCGLRGWDKNHQRGVYQPFIFIMQIWALALIQLMRKHGTPGLSLPELQFIPMALLGTWFGLGIFRRLSDRTFAITVNALLLVSGIGLLV